MDRRDFLKLAASSGLSLVSPLTPREVKAQEHGYEGPFFLHFNAQGGWDTTVFCDPKGINGINRWYKEGDIETTGPFRYAPLAQNKLFFERYAKDLLVINGIDATTNNHQVGLRYMWTGHRSSTAYPTFGALASAANGVSLPLSYISFGGYDNNGGLVPLSRVRNPYAIPDLANHDKMNAIHLGRGKSTPYHSEFAQRQIALATEKREKNQLLRQKLPLLRQKMSTLFVAKLGGTNLRRLLEHLPSELPEKNPIAVQALIALAAYKAGLSVSAILKPSNNGFDTHYNNDALQKGLFVDLLKAFDEVVHQAEKLGVKDKVLFIMGSEFSRTPYYGDGEDGAGKTHWGTASMVLMGPGIKGNRLIGATDDGQKVMTVNPKTLSLDDTKDGIRMKPVHIHRALRRLAGIDQHPLNNKFPLKAQDLPLFPV